MTTTTSSSSSAAPANAGGGGATLLNELRTALRRYVVFPNDAAADAATLWIAATHGQPFWAHAPRLAVISPVKRSGKSRLLDLVYELAYRPLLTVNTTVAALVRSLDEDDPPTVLVDEADALFGSKKAADGNEDLRGVLNAGFQRNRPLNRWDVNHRRLEQLQCFAMVALASIGDLPDTIQDRAVVVRMRRRAAGETVQPFRDRRDAPALNQLRDRLHKWVRRDKRRLRAAAPTMTLEDRAADTWEPLFVVADLAGGEWPARVRIAAETLVEADAEADDVGVRLLENLYTLFETTTALYSATMVERLLELEDGGWSDWNYGRGLNQRGLAKLLRPFEIKPDSIRVGDDQTTRKGYRVEWFHDAWDRYCPHLRNSRSIRNTAGQSANGQRNTAGAEAEQAEVFRLRSAGAPDAKPPLTRGVPDAPAVPEMGAAVAEMRKADQQWSDADDAAWQAGRLSGTDTDDPRRWTR
jgi:Protein of unknown function (DUF3631)